MLVSTVEHGGGVRSASGVTARKGWQGADSLTSERP
jgi:hypothetical protein